MFQSAEFEAAIMARRIDIHAFCAEARRLEESRGGDGSELGVGITIPWGWLPSLAEGLDSVIRKWEREDADERPADDTDFDAGELLERMRSLASAIREVEPSNAYTVGLCDYDALFRGIVGALHIQEFELRCLPEDVDPPALRFVAIEQRDALCQFYSILFDLLLACEEP
ncbi:MAG TPA: hypothetical protein VIJ39_11830 [Solirubrobacteraceae bacterium]